MLAAPNESSFRRDSSALLPIGADGRGLPGEYPQEDEAEKVGGFDCLSCEVVIFHCRSRNMKFSGFGELRAKIAEMGK